MYTVGNNMATSTSSMLLFSSCSPEQDADLEVAYEDQQKINMFARKNARLVDLKEEIDAKEVSDCCC